jgi:AraC-like DNA-binding protein
MTRASATEETLRLALLARLARLRAPPGVSGASPLGAPGAATVFGYCVYTRERIRRARLEHPAIVVVLSGTKELWRGDACERMAAGAPFVIPGGVELDLVNVPDPRTGRYESICITVDADLRQALRPSVGRERVVAGGAHGSAIALTPDLVEAYGHAAAALSDSRHAADLARHRILEILLLVREAPAARALFAATLAERAESVVRGDLARAWRVEDVAAALGLGASTLRRRLKASGTSFRDVVLAARMAEAGALLGARDYSVTQAAQAAGYASRSHFARRFRAAHGVAPSRMRQAAGDDVGAAAHPPAPT